MTHSNFKEAHPHMTWKPNLLGHQQKRVSLKVYESLQERTKAITKEIIKNKTNLDSNKKILTEF